jgi:septal ring factor EnvC (AmiA/AmiB activator)
MYCKARLFPKRSLFPATLLIAGALCACQHTDPAVTRSEQTADLLVSTRQSMLVGDQTVAESQAALTALRQSKGDLRPAFEQFLSELQAVRKQADRMEKESQAVHDQSQLYLAARQNDVSTINNDEMRQAAVQRTAHVKEKCDDIKDRYAAVNASFARYIRSLSDLQTYLANELNYGALDSGQKWIDQALSSGEMLRGNIRDLSREIELTSNLLSPVPIAATQWQTTLQQPDALAEQR